MIFFYIQINISILNRNSGKETTQLFSDCYCPKRYRQIIVSSVTCIWLLKGHKHKKSASCYQPFSSDLYHYLINRSVSCLNFRNRYQRARPLYLLLTFEFLSASAQDEKHFRTLSSRSFHLDIQFISTCSCSKTPFFFTSKIIYHNK